MRCWLCAPLLWLAAASGIAEQALVRNYQNASLEIGLGYLTHYDGTCYLLLPKHVANEAGGTAALLGEGIRPLLGETAEIFDLGDDVALAVVKGGLTAGCGFSAQSISRAVDRTIRDNGLATLRSVNGDGSIAQLAVSIFDNDGERFLRIQPANNDNQLRKGQSGSLLVAGDRPVGMLLSVNARHGVGKVIRLDTMLAKFDAHIRDRPRTIAAAPAGDRAATSPAGEPRTVARQPLELLSWSAVAASASERPLNLLALDDRPGWRANVTDWPVILEFGLGEERVAIRGLRLEAHASPPSALPGIVELFITATEGRDRWRSAFGGGLTYDNGVAVISMAPTWARKIRLVISASNGDPSQVALSRIRVLVAD